MIRFWDNIPLRRRLALILAPVLALAAVASVWAVLGADFGPAPVPSDGWTESDPSSRLQTEGLTADGKLMFPRTADLKFDTRGTVGEVLAGPGQRVTAGQVLATMDATTLARLESGYTGAMVTVRRAGEALDTINAATPVELAQAEAAVARAQVTLDNAEEALDNLTLPEDTVTAAAEAAVARARLDLKSAEEGLGDLERDHSLRVSLSMRALAAASVALDQAWDALADLDVTQEQRLGQALQGRAGAELALDRAQELLEEFDLHFARDLASAEGTAAGASIALDKAADALADFLIDHSQRLSQAREAKAGAELALDQARTALADFDPQQAQRLAAALLTRASAEAALDRAEESLAHFDLDYAERLATAKLAHTQAKLDLDAADDRVSRHIFTIGVSRPFDEDFIEELRALQAAASLALAHFNTTKDALEQVEEGADPLVQRELESSVELARASLEVAEKDLATLQGGQQAFLARQLSATVAVAESNLRKITQSATRLEEGPDPLEKLRLEAAVALARSADTDAKRELDELEQGPDPLLRAKLEADVDAARAALSTADQALDKVQRDEEDLKIFAETGLLKTVEGVLEALSPGALNGGSQPELGGGQTTQLMVAEAKLALAAGADPLEVALRVSEVDAARADLEQARDSLADVGIVVDARDRDFLVRQMLLAEANLFQAIEDLEDLTVNIDPLLINAATKDVGLAEATLLEAETHLEALLSRLGLDRVQRQSELALARQMAEDARRDLEGGTITAPFDGVVYLVNAEADDEVDTESLIVRLVDPTVVEIAALVSGSDVGLVRVGADAAVTFGGRTDSTRSGTVTRVATKPRTERGILSYEVRIRVDAPDGIDVTLTGVSVVIDAGASATGERHPYGYSGRSISPSGAASPDVLAGESTTL